MKVIWLVPVRRLIVHLASVSRGLSILFLLAPMVVSLCIANGLWAHRVIQESKTIDQG